MNREGEEIIAEMNLKPLKPEGGWFRRIWYRPGEIAQIYYFLGEDDFSEFHSIPVQEQFIFLKGDAVELYMADETRWERRVLGHRSDRGERLTCLVEVGWYQSLRLVPGGSWALMSTVTAPSFEWKNYRSVGRDELLSLHGEHRSVILRQTRF